MIQLWIPNDFLMINHFSFYTLKNRQYIKWTCSSRKWTWRCEDLKSGFYKSSLMEYGLVTWLYVNEKTCSHQRSCNLLCNLRSIKSTLSALVLISLSISYGWLLRSWWQADVGDFMLVTKFWYWWHILDVGNWRLC